MSDEKNEQNAESKWKSRELGALWKRQGRNQNYLTGKIKIGEFGVEKEVKVVIFTNKNREKNERAPDFIVYESEPAESQDASSSTTASSTASAAEATPEAPASTTEVENQEVPDLLI
jgi:hypothetical protein|tara:strand:+ start:10055 stop:10405 length:351 start_codon:yes stop_codon:yes gene_type:complete